MCESHFRSCSDKELVDLILSGEQAAARVLVERYHRYLLTVLFTWHLQECDQEDVLQQTWSSAFRALGNANFSRAWLAKIANNAAYKLTQARKKKSMQPLPEFDTASPEPNVLELLDYRELLALLKLRLPALEYQVLHESFINERRSRELAQLLGESIESIYNLKRRALKSARAVAMELSIPPASQRNFDHTL